MTQTHQGRNFTLEANLTVSAFCYSILTHRFLLLYFNTYLMNMGGTKIWLYLTEKSPWDARQIPSLLRSQVKLAYTDRNVCRITPTLGFPNARKSGQTRIYGSERPLHNLGFSETRLPKRFGHRPRDRAHTRSLMASASQEISGISSTSARLKLYSFWGSSCAWRVRIALNLKGLPYEYKAVNLGQEEQFSEEFTKLNPLQFVPTLVDGDIIVADSLAILLYLEDKFSGHPLLPDDFQSKAISLQAAALVGSSIQPLQNTCVLKLIEEKLEPKEHQAWPKHFIEKGFTALEKLLKDVAGKYSIGDKLTLADIFLVPQVYNARRYNVDMSKFPTLNRIDQALAELPEFQAALPDRQPDAKA